MDWVERDWEVKIRILPDQDDTILPNQIYPHQDLGSREDLEVLVVEVVDMDKVLHPDMGIIEVVHLWEEEGTEMEMEMVVDMEAEVEVEAVVDMVVDVADMMIVARPLDITMIVVHLQGEVEDMAAAAVVVIAVAVDLLQAMEEEDIMMDHVMEVVVVVEDKEVDTVTEAIAEEV